MIGEREILLRDTLRMAKRDGHDVQLDVMSNGVGNAACDGCGLVCIKHAALPDGSADGCLSSAAIGQKAAAQRKEDGVPFQKQRFSIVALASKRFHSRHNSHAGLIMQRISITHLPYA